jgi:hypothetical protein
LLRNERASAGNDGIGGGCTTLEGCLTPIECDATGRKSPQQDRSHKRWREANGGAQCGKSARCVRRGGDWKRGTVERPAGAPALDPTCGSRRRAAASGDPVLGVKFLGPTRQKPTSGNDCFWRILLQKSEIEQSLKSRGSRFLVGSAAATLSRIDTTVCGLFCVRRFGPSRRHVRNASAVLKNFVRHPKETFSTLLAQSGHSSILTDNEFMQSFEPKPRGAPAKKPRRTARELTTFRSPPENLLVRTNRVRTAKKQACEKWTLTSLADRFPVIA